jgi:hypothetical protein
MLQTTNQMIIMCTFLSFEIFLILFGGSQDLKIVNSDQHRNIKSMNETIKWCFLFFRQPSCHKNECFLNGPLKIITSELGTPLRLH